MSQTTTNAGAPGNTELHSALFAHLVMQQVNMALMFMGRLENPETGKAETRDLDAAKMFIDMLEMLEAKTKGNRSAQEESLLKQSLMNVRMAFVEAVDEKAPSTAASASAAASQSPPNAAPADSSGSAGTSPGEEHRPKFSKKY